MPEAEIEKPKTAEYVALTSAVLSGALRLSPWLAQDEPGSQSGVV